MQNEITSGEDLMQDFWQPTPTKGTDATTTSSTPPPPPPDQGNHVVIEAPPTAATQAPPVSISADLQAELYVNLLDGLSSTIFYSINNRKKRRRLGADSDKAALLAHKMQNGEVPKGSLTDEERALAITLQNLDDIEQDIPLTDDEKKSIENPLAKIIEQAGYDLPPGMALLFAVLPIMASRITAAMFD